MSNKQISERVIKEKFQTLDKLLNTKIYHNESDLYYNDGLVYKIFKPTFRLDREKNLYFMKNKNFPYANNIIDFLYQGDKLIGVTNKYLDNFETMKTRMNKLDLYDIKNILQYIIKFYEKTINDNLIYWDNHLNNMGIVNNNFYIIDIDSMVKITNDKDIFYAMNGLLSLFYEMYYKIPIRNNYENYRTIISLISECDNYKEYKLTLKELKNIIDNTSIDYLESKRNILELKKI